MKGLNRLKNYFAPKEEGGAHTIWKSCFVCRTHGHILSNSQLDKLKADCKDRKGNINWKRVEEKLEDPEIQCNICHGEGEIPYQHI